MRLTGLHADNPIAWMAACGALRLLPGARLRWDDATPELDYEGDLLAALAALPPERLKAPEFQYKHKLGSTMTPGAWRDLQALPGDWALAFGCQTESGMTATRLKIRPGDYDMIQDGRTVLERLVRLDIRDKLVEALEGPGATRTTTASPGAGMPQRESMPPPSAARQRTPPSLVCSALIGWDGRPCRFFPPSTARPWVGRTD